MTKVKLENIFPIGLAEPPVMVNRFGDVSFAFAYQGPEMFSSSRESFLSLNTIFDSALNFLDESYVIHKQDIFLETVYKSEQPEYDTFLSRAYSDHFKNKRYYKAHSYIYVTKVNGLRLNRTHGLSRSHEKSKATQFTASLDVVRDTVFAYVNHLKGNGLVIQPLNSEEALGKLFQGSLSGYDDSAFSDLTFTDDGIVIGVEKRLGVLSINSDESLPAHVLPYQENQHYSRKGNDNVLLSDFLYALGAGNQSNHVVNTMLFLDGQRFWKDELEKRSKRLHSFSKFGSENQRLLEDNNAFLDATYRDEGKKIVRAHVNVTYWADDKDSFKNTRQTLKSEFISLGIVPHINNYLDQKAVYLSSFPGNAGTMPFEETFVTHSNVASCFFLKESVIDRSKGKPSADGLIYTDRVSNIPSFRDSWRKPYESKAISSRNILTVGESGGGKSSTVIELLRQFLEMGFDVTAIDIGRSFEIFCKTYGGNYIVYEEGMSLGINPFQLNDERLTVTNLEFLASFIPILWNPDREFTSENISALEKLLLRFYQAEKNEVADYSIGIDGTTTDIAAFFHFIESNRDLVSDVTKGKESFFDADSFLLSMEKYVDGKFDQLFKSTSDKLVDPSKSLTCFELDNIKDHKTLFPIFSMLITHMCTEVLWKKRNSEKLFWFDEAWKVLEKPGMAALLKYLYKTVRKFDGGVGINIQTIGDLKVPGNESIEETILGNSPVKLLMKHKDELVDAVVEKLKLGEHGRALLRSINSDLKGRYPYTEHLNIIGSDMKVMRMMVSPYQRVNFMSEFKDKSTFFKFLEESGSIEKAFEQFVQFKNWAA